MNSLTLNETLDLLLEETPVDHRRFADIVARLYASGTLMREDSARQARLFDDALRINDLLVDYFSLAGFRLIYNREFQYYRLLPPSPAAQEDEDEGHVGRLRARLTGMFPALLLVLRHLYQVKMDSGDLTDKAEALVLLLDVQQAYVDLLHREWPGSRQTRIDAYQELSVQKLVSLPDAWRNEVEDMVFAIRPTLLDFVSEAWLKAAREASELKAASPEMQDAALPEREPLSVPEAGK